jgi:PAS domain S-box-containing protein
MSNKKINILLLEDNAGDALLVKEALSESSFRNATIFGASSLKDAIKFSTENIPLLLVDLGLPDSDGLDTVRQIHNYFPDSTLIVLTGMDDEKLAIQTLKVGAQNYMNKNEIEIKTLERTIQFSLERHKNIQQLKAAITDLEQAEIKITKTNRLYSFISQVNQSIVHIADEQTLFRNACSIAFLHGKFKIAWIGLFDDNHRKIRLVEQNGIVAEDIKRFTDIPVRANDLQANVIRNGKNFICNDIAHNAELESLIPLTPEQRVCSCMILPIKKSGNVIGTFNLYSCERHFFDSEEIRMLTEVAGDISFAVEVFEKAKKQKETEELIKKREKRFQALIEKGTDMILLSSRDGKILYNSPSVKKILAHSSEDILNTSIINIIHPDDVPDFIEKREALLQTPGESCYIQQRILHKNGDWIWCDGTLTNMLHERSIEAFIGNFRNISERKIAEQELSKTSNNLQKTLSDLQKIMNSSLDMICSINKEGKFVNVSAASKNILGYKPEELYGKKYIDMVLHDDIEKTNKIASEILSGTPIVFFENRYLHKNGDIINIVWSAKWDTDDKLMYCIAKDVTDRKKIEQQLDKSEAFSRGVLNSLTSHIAVVNNKGDIIAVNESWTKFSLENGDTTLERTGVGSNYFKVCEKSAMAGDTTAPEVLQAMKNIFNEKETAFSLEYPCHSPIEQRWFGLHIMKFDSSEQLIVVTHENITERKLADLERTKVTADLIQRNNDLEQFSYIVSHNLRAPVANIIGIASVVQDKNFDAEMRIQITEQLSYSAKKLDNVISDLNLILQTKREISQQKEIIYFSKLVQDIQTSIENLIEKEKAIIVWDFSEVDKMQTLKCYLHSIFYNLISNSLKYRQPNIAPVILIKSQKFSNKIVLQFKDNGMGIDLKNKSNHVFGLYKRFHTSVAEGKGMGLYMVKTQVETIGGKISIESEVNKGTTFIIEFKT